MAEINIGGELVPKTMAKKVAKSEYVYDPSHGDKKQSEINEELYQSKDVLLFDSVVASEIPAIEPVTQNEPDEIIYSSFNKKFIAAVDNGGLQMHYYAWPGYKKYTDTTNDNKPYDNKVYLCGGKTYVWNGTDLIANEQADKAYTPLTYSGMGRVYLRKNMVNEVNTLTQDMFYKGEVGSRVPNTNTIYVIQYDFTLGEDITVPANCVLKFDGGSIDGAHILTFTNTFVIGIECFGSTINFAGNLRNDTVSLNIFKDNTEPIINIQKLVGNYNYVDKTGTAYNSGKTFIIPKGTYIITRGTHLCGLTGVVIDLGGSTITDNITYIDPLSGRIQNIFCIVDSSNIEIKNGKIICNKQLSGYNSSAIGIGGSGLVTTNKLTHNIRIHDIEGNSEGLVIPSTADMGYGFVCGYGEVFNIELYNITWTGPLTQLTNFEYSHRDWPDIGESSDIFPEHYGVRPHDIHIYNINCYGVKSENIASVVLRCSSTYNYLAENIHCEDCNTAVVIYNGDDGIARTRQNVTIRNLQSIRNSDKTANISKIDIVCPTANTNREYNHPDFVNHDFVILFENIIIDNGNNGINITGNQGNIKVDNCFITNCNSAISWLIPSSQKNNMGTLLVSNSIFEYNSYGIVIYNNPISVENCIFRTKDESYSQIYCSYTTYITDFNLVNKIDRCIFRFLGTNKSNPFIRIFNDGDIDFVSTRNKQSVIISNNLFEGCTADAPGVDGRIPCIYENNIGSYITSGKVNENNYNNGNVALVSYLAESKNNNTINGEIFQTYIYGYGAAPAIVGVISIYQNCKEITIFKTAVSNLVFNNTNKYLLDFVSVETVTISGTGVIKLYRVDEDLQEWHLSVSQGLTISQ